MTSPEPQPPPPLVSPAPETEARAALDRFLAAEKAQNFEAVYESLSAPLRARYTPARLESDYRRDVDLAQDKLARIRAALSTNPALQLDGPDAAHLPLAGDRAVRLVREADGWHLASLE